MGYLPNKGTIKGDGNTMHRRARSMTLTQVNNMCKETGDDPVVVVGDLLAGMHDGADVLGLLLPGRTQRGEDTVKVA